ncbi:MAG: competence type IV pilus major pilin ComGC [Sporichthyaceae bacterium]
MINRIRAARATAADQGFTLVEMLIVIVVLGVLAGITVFGVATFRDDAEASACSASIKTVDVAADAWRAKPGNTGNPTVAQLVSGNYLKATPATAYGIAIDSTTGVVTGSC